MEAVGLLVAASKSKSLEMEEELRKLIPKQGVVLHELKEGRARPLGKVETPLDIEKLLTAPPPSSSEPPMPRPSMVSRAVLPPVTSLKSLLMVATELGTIMLTNSW